MNRSRFKLDQNHAPIHEALEKFLRMRVVPFDVPGHKRGRGNPELTEFLGQKCVGVDVNSMKPLDNLCLLYTSYFKNTCKISCTPCDTVNADLCAARYEEYHYCNDLILYSDLYRRIKL